MKQSAKKSLAIVLPVHNCESQLYMQIEQLLELASELTDNFRILIVDDGSTDDTFEVASDMVVRFPQVSVTRHAVQRGIGPTIEMVRKQVKADMVVVHDGVTKIDANQVRQLWQQCEQSATGMMANSDAQDQHSMNDLADVAKTHAALEQAHRRMAGFQFLPSLAQAEIEDDDSVDRNESTHMAHHHAQHGNTAVGSIPPLPRPNFLQVISQFALGE